MKIDICKECEKHQKCFFEKNNLVCKKIQIQSEKQEIQDLKETIRKRNLLIKQLRNRIDDLEEFCRSEVMCDCGKSLWLANFTNNPL